MCREFSGDRSANENLLKGTSGDYFNRARSDCLKSKIKYKEISRTGAWREEPKRKRKKI